MMTTPPSATFTFATVYIVALSLGSTSMMTASPLPPPASAPEVEESPHVVPVAELPYKGTYICRQGSALFVTSDKRHEQPGYYFTIGADSKTLTLVSAKLPAAWDIAVAGNYAYLCDYTAALTVFDMSGGQWRLAGVVTTPSRTENVIIRGQYAYVADHIAGLQIVDISNPLVPRIVSEDRMEGDDIDGVELWGSSALLYSHHAGLLRLVDIDKPSQPKKTGLYTHAGKFNQGEIAVDEHGFAYCTATKGTVAIVDVRDPTGPKLSKVLTVPGNVTDVVYETGYLYIAAGSGGVRVWDVRKPEQAVEVGDYTAPDANISQLAVRDGFIYAANQQKTLLILAFHKGTTEGE